MTWCCMPRAWNAQGNPESGLMPSSAAPLLMLASPRAVGTSASRAVRKTEEHSLSLLWLLTYFFSIFYMSISLKIKITKYWTMSNPHVRAIKGLQPIFPSWSPTCDFCLLLYQAERGKVETNRGKRGRFRVCQCTDSLQKIKSEICKTAPWFF